MVTVHRESHLCLKHEARYSSRFVCWNLFRNFDPGYHGSIVQTRKEAGLGVEPDYSDSQVRCSVPYPRRVWVASSERGCKFGQALEVCRAGLMAPGNAGIREVKPPAADHTACVGGASSLMRWPSPSLGCAQSKGRATQTTGEGPRALRATLLIPVPGAGTGGPMINSPLQQAWGVLDYPYLLLT